MAMLTMLVMTMLTMVMAMLMMLTFNEVLVLVHGADGVLPIVL